MKTKMFVVVELYDYVKSVPVRVFHTKESAQKWIDEKRSSTEYDELYYVEVEVE